MARYIDADALKLDIDLSKGASVLDMAISVIKAVQEAPTADVVPKSEVAREIITEIADTCKGGDSVNISFAIGYMSAMNKVLDKLAELKKKYTEG